MARKKQESHVNHERWLVSYADFITLMFAFFVVMFASTQTDRSKAQQVSDSVKRALEQNQVVAALTGILGGSVDEKGMGNAQMRGPGGARKGNEKAPSGKMAELLPSFHFLNTQLQSEIKAGKVQMHLGSRGLIVSLKEAAFFPPGGDTVDPSSYDTIDKIATSMRQLPNPVRLEGHTDSVPIHNERFRSNWELSAARGIAMLVILTEKFQVPREKLAVAGYADTVPVDTNETDEGRARNRRVDIVILNQSGMTAEPTGKEADTAAPAREKPSPFPEAAPPAGQ